MLQSRPGGRDSRATGVITAYHWSWVVLLAVVAVIAGAGMRFGWLPSLLMLTFAATFPVATSLAGHAAAYGGIAAIATLYGVVLARRFSTRGGRGPARLPPGCRRRGGRVRHRTRRRGGDRRGPGLDRARPGAGADYHPHPLHPDGQAGADPGEGDRHCARGYRRGTGGDRSAACLAGLRHCRRGVRARVHDVQEVLALLRLVHVRSGPGPGSPGPGRPRGRASRFRILAGIAILVVGLAILYPLAAWLSKRYPEPELAENDESAESPVQSSPSSPASAP